MKFKGSLFFSALIIIFLVAALPSNTNNAEKDAILMQTLLNGLNQLHFHPQEINDNFSEEVYSSYLSNYLDSRKRWLTQEDVDRLVAFEKEIDNEILNGTYEFFDLSIKLQNEAWQRTQQYYKEILAEAFDYKKEETLEIDEEKREFAKNETELKERWRKILKYQTLSKLTDKLEAQEKKDKKDKKEKTEEIEEKKSFEELEEEARKDVLKMFDRFYERILKQKRTKKLGDYLNAITNAYDPHTGYFAPIEKDNFDISMSGRLEGIGARLTTEQGKTKISSVVVGGPAWKQKELEANDYILKVAQGDDEPVDIIDWELNEVVKIIRGKKGTIVNLTVEKGDGTLKVITIERDEVVLDEGYAKSLIVDYTDVIDNIGYIRLPRFYADFNKRDGRHCAEDIAKELEKLKTQNVNGIILDLRNNGGGSLRDVVKMSGLFIEKGPIVQVKSREKEPEIMADRNPAVQYDGPLIVMVNSMSASASEIIAAALQDYNRAIIIGSESTFGKGTVQRFFDLDRAIQGHDDIKPLGEVKLTMQKFYRVNGGSTQLKGVNSDIILPGRYNYITVGEKRYDNAMAWTEIEAVDYSQNTYVISDKDKAALKLASEARVQDNVVFNKINSSALLIKKREDETLYPLNIDKFDVLLDKREAEAKQYDDMYAEIAGLSFENIPVDMEYINQDSSRIATNGDWIKGLKEDVYLEETLQVMHDLISIKKQGNIAKQEMKMEEE